MRNFILSINLIICIQISFAQTTSKSLVHGGLTRSYKEHVPTIYNPSTPVPLMICLHGLGDNMTNFMGIGMNQLANTENFIVLTPQAVNSPFGTAWNSGASYMGYQINASIDDLGFIEKLIDTTMSLYNIDSSRVYAMGFSMGGFMCHRLACELNNRIAAIASVAGTIGASLNCTPGRAVPVCHFHGTKDSTVYYNGNMYGMDAVPLVQFWVNNNNCDTTPQIIDIPDVAQDGFTIKHFIYDNGDDNTMVEHYRVDSADHQWIYPPNNDMSYTLAIWDFVKRFSLPSWINIEKPTTKKDISIFPNPSSELIYLNNIPDNSHILLYDIFGRIIYENYHFNNQDFINIKQYNKGLYIINIYCENKIILTDKIIKQ